VAATIMVAEKERNFSDTNGMHCIESKHIKVM
jgi:hypothetical protein